MTDWLSRLQEVFGARSKGRWHADRDCDVHNLDVFEWEPDLDIDMPKFVARTHFQKYGRDSQFIAMAGTIADELLAVIVAADRICLEKTIDALDETTVLDCRILGIDKVEIALAALKAKVEGMASK